MAKKKKKTKRYRLSDIMRAIAHETFNTSVQRAARNVAGECAAWGGPFAARARTMCISLPTALGEPQWEWYETERVYVERIAQAAVREARRLGVPMVECGP